MGKKFSNTDKHHKPTGLRSTKYKIKELKSTKRKKNSVKSRVLYSVKISFNNEGIMKTLKTDKNWSNSSTVDALQEIKSLGRKKMMPDGYLDLC